MLAEMTTFRPNPRVEFRRLGDGEGAVLLHLDTAAYHGLNEVGVFVWKTIENGATFEEVIAQLRANIEDTPPELEQEIKEFLDELASRDLVLVG